MTNDKNKEEAGRNVRESSRIHLKVLSEFPQYSVYIVIYTELYTVLQYSVYTVLYTVLQCSVYTAL